LPPIHWSRTFPARQHTRMTFIRNVIRAAATTFSLFVLFLQPK
jgi:hypothetical protein